MKNWSKVLFILVILILAGVAIGFAAEFLTKDKATTSAANDNYGADVKLAKVGDDVITLKQLNETFNFDAAQLQGTDPNQLYQMLVQQLIGQKLIDQAAKEEVSDRNKTVREELEKAKTQIKRNVYLEEMFAKEITEKDLVLAYQEFVSQIPESTERQIRARHILVKEKAEAEKMIAELNDGKDFAGLAAQYSQDPAGKSNGGDLGFFSQEQMVQPFAEAAFKLDVGEYSKEPIKTQFGWHVIQVEAKRVKPKPTFEEVRAEIENSLRQQILEKKLDELNQKYDVVRYNPSTGEEIVEGGEQQPAPADETDITPNTIEQPVTE